METNYWDSRYLSGKNSGEGSFGNIRRLKHEIMNDHHVGNDIIDVGCANLEFWAGFELPDKYVGIDISEEAIRKNKINYPNKIFICANASDFLNLSAKTVICFDMLFHILDDDEYKKIIINLCKYSQDKIFIYTWCKNPLKKFFIPIRSDGIYQKYRNTNILINICHDNGFLLKGINYNPSIDKYGIMLVFEKYQPNKIIL